MAEKEIWREKELTPKTQRIEEFENWILGPGNTRDRLSLYNQTMDLYCSVKALLGKTLTKRQEAYGNILEQLDKVHSELVPLETIPYHLKVIEAKQALLTESWGSSLKLQRKQWHPQQSPPSSTWTQNRVQLWAVRPLGLPPPLPLQNDMVTSLCFSVSHGDSKVSS